MRAKTFAVTVPPLHSSSVGGEIRSFIEVWRVPALVERADDLFVCVLAIERIRKVIYSNNSLAREKSPHEDWVAVLALGGLWCLA
jgi:hypothetical protein